MDTLKIRPKNAVIKELHVTKEMREKVKEKLKTSPMKKGEVIRQIVGFKGCSSCGGVPDMEITYKLGGATRIERYCEKCAKMVFERENKLPTDNKALQEYYGIIKGELPKSVLT